MDDPSSPPSRRAVWSDFEGTEYEHDEHWSDEDDWVGICILALYLCKSLLGSHVVVVRGCCR